MFTGGLLNNAIYAWKLKAVMEKFMVSFRWTSYICDLQAFIY